MKRIIKYLVVTFTITWILWWGDAAIVKYTSLVESDLLPMILFTLGGFGPTISALICFKGKINKRNVIIFLFGNSSKAIYVLLFFALAELAVFGLSSMELNSALAPVMIPLVVLQASLFYGGNEELGWRGVMQLELQEKMPYPVATLVVGAAWALWHLPLWFIEGNSHVGSSFIAFALLAILLSFWLSALINSGYGVFYCMILHGITNTLLSVFVIKINTILIIGLIILTVVSIIISMLSIDRFSRTGKTNLPNKGE